MIDSLNVFIHLKIVKKFKTFTRPAINSGKRGYGSCVDSFVLDHWQEPNDAIHCIAACYFARGRA